MGLHRLPGLTSYGPSEIHPMPMATLVLEAACCMAAGPPFDCGTGLAGVVNATLVSAYYNAQKQAYLQPGSAGWFAWSYKVRARDLRDWACAASPCNLSASAVADSVYRCAVHRWQPAPVGSGASSSAMPAGTWRMQHCLACQRRRW